MSIVTCRYNHNADAAMRKYNKIRLTRTTIQHNGEAGMRGNDLHRQRFQQHTVGLALVGLEKGELFVFKKTIGFALTKADCFALKKAGCSFSKKRFFRLKKGIWFALKKADFFVLRTVGCVLRGAYATIRIGGSPM
jgi:hypothetical protein